MVKFAGTIRRAPRRARKALALLSACGASAFVGAAVPVVVSHLDAEKQTAADNRQADAAFEQAQAAREEARAAGEQADAANRAALCPDVMQARREALKAKAALDPETKRVVAWCL